jgi:hypothetical protein
MAEGHFPSEIAHGTATTLGRNCGWTLLRRLVWQALGLGLLKPTRGRRVLCLSERCRP